MFTHRAIPRNGPGPAAGTVPPQGGRREATQGGRSFRGHGGLTSGMRATMVPVRRAR